MGFSTWVWLPPPPKQTNTNTIKLQVNNECLRSWSKNSSARAGAKGERPKADALRRGLLTLAWETRTLLPHRRGLTLRCSAEPPAAERGPPCRGRPLSLPRTTPARKRGPLWGFAPSLPETRRQKSCHSSAAAAPACRPGSQVWRGQVTAPARPTTPAASPHPVLRLHPRGPRGSSSGSWGCPAPTYLRDPGPGRPRSPPRALRAARGAPAAAVRRHFLG